jgi:YegS/Rv2252/BmrU family lipid kinase
VSPTLIIVNPAARSEKAKALFQKIEKLSSKTRIRMTSAPGEARDLAEAAARQGCKRIVAAGGDGTVNEVVNGIAGCDVTLGVLPIGTMNVFASELGIPTGNLHKCWELIEKGTTRLVDLPSANSHKFVQLAGIGFDAQIVAATSFDSKKTFGPLSYVISATQIAAQKPPRLVVESEEVSCEGSFVLVGNGRYYGGPFVIFKEARIDDGKLDVLVFKNLGYLDIVRYLQAIIFGTHTKLADVEYFQTKKLSVRSEDRVPVEVDGEVIGEVPVTFRVAPGKLRVFAPPA